MNKVGRPRTLAKQVLMEEGHACMPDGHVEQADVNVTFDTPNQRVKL
jgi:hypothetical protein